MMVSPIAFGNKGPGQTWQFILWYPSFKRLERFDSMIEFQNINPSNDCRWHALLAKIMNDIVSVLASNRHQVSNKDLWGLISLWSHLRPIQYIAWNMHPVLLSFVLLYLKHQFFEPLVIRMSQLMAVCHPDYLCPIKYVIQMTYDVALSHPDDITNPDDLLEVISHPDESRQIHDVIRITYATTL